MLAQGFIDLGLCKGTLDEVLENGSVQAVLHAPRRPLARHGRARRRPLPGEGRVAAARARHGAHGRAGRVHPPGRQRARGILEHRRAHRGRRARHRRRPREPDGRRAEDGRRRRSAACSAAGARARHARRRRSSAPARSAPRSRSRSRRGSRRRRARRARRPASIARGDRSLALSHGARLILERLGVWPRARGDAGRGHADRRRSTSRRRGGFGARALDAAEHGLPALGYVVSYRALAGGARRRARAARVDVRFGAAVARGDGSTPAQATVDARRRPALQIARDSPSSPTARRRPSPASRASATTTGRSRSSPRCRHERAARRRRLRALHAGRPGGAAARRRPLRARVDA